MHTVVKELERKLDELDTAKAEELAALVRDAMKLAGSTDGNGKKYLPESYFEKHAGSLAGEQFERPDQGTFPIRENW